MHSVAELVASYGYVALFLLIGLESFGIPLPGEIALVTAGAFAARGRLDIGLVILAAAAGAIVGDNAGYWLGRTGGIAIVHRFGRRVGLNELKVARMHAFFGRYGAKTVFIGRFIALLRSWAAVLAGVAEMPYGRFTCFNVAGGATWAVLFGSLGYAFGHNLPLLERYAGQVTLALALLVALGSATYLGVRWLRADSTHLGEAISDRWQRAARSPHVARLRARYPRLWTFVAARAARGEYLGLHLTIGLAVSLAALWVFGGVTEDVIHHHPLTTLDLQLSLWLRNHAGATGDRVALAVTSLGSPVWIASLLVVVAGVLARRRQWIPLAGWVAAIAGSGVLDLALKRAIHRPRPAGAADFLQNASFSFPSGHAMGSLIAYGMLLYLLLAHWPQARRHTAPVSVVAVVLVLAIGVSRLYLGVHFLSDVIGGYAAGVVWLAACVTGVEITVRQRRQNA